MYPAEFAYVRPDGLDAVFTAVDEYADDAKVIAGGQSLLPLMKLRLATPAMLIDLAGAGELSGQHRTPSGVRLGAMTTYRELQHSPHTLGLLPGLGDTVAVIADTQVRARGTIGGAVAHGDPTADLPAMLLALEAQVHIGSRRGHRRVALDGFITGVFSTGLADGEIVTALEIPLPPAGTGAAYEKVEQPASHLALAGVAAVLTVEAGTVRRARVAMTGVTTTPRRLTAVERALVGSTTSDVALSEAAALAVDGVVPLDDVHASPQYRLHLLEVATRQALQVAARRAGARWAA